MADILANPVDICFGSMPVKSTTPAACLVIEDNAVASNQQVGMDLLAETVGHTPRVLMQGRKNSRRRTPSRIPLYSY
jgi:hypothetical protein